ncbi:MAG TPA: CPCC family cysteine-rich protein [Kofleriaceae bacterium]|jgi:hypothetical protein
MAERLACACCGSLTMSEPDSYDICPVCFWEDDPVQNANDAVDGGANTVSLREARRNYLQFGVSEPEFIDKVRSATADETPPFGADRKLSLLPLQSEQALAAYLARHGDRAVRIGSAEHAPQFHAVFVGDVAIGIVSEQHGLAPAAAAFDQQGAFSVLIGHDQKVSAIDARSKRAVTTDLPRLFYDFLLLERGAIAFHELGAVRLDVDGSVRWSADGGDVLTRFNVKPPDTLELEFMEGAVIEVEIASGATRRVR